MSEKEEAAAAAVYHWKDFEWEQLRRDVENDPNFGYHLIPLDGNDVVSSSVRSQHSPPPRAWDQFHSRHSTGKFFKERRYLVKEFPELVSCDENSIVLEVGCGSASTALPILRANNSILVYACDCSTEALVRAEEIIDASDVASAGIRFHPFCCDFSTSGFPKWLICNSCQEGYLREQNVSHSDVNGNSRDFTLSMRQECCIGGVDYVTLVFTLSAVPLHRMPTAIAACFSALKPGGLLFFRDYGLYDMTMLRFESEQRVGFREYERSDGTLSYFFSLEAARDLFAGSGFVELELEYCCIKSINRKKEKAMRRVWIHGKFMKPK